MIHMKKVLMVMPHMVGGGAERVAALLMNYFYNNGIDAKFVLTSAYQKDVVRCDLQDEIPLILLQEEIGKESEKEKIKYLPTKISSKVFCRLYEKNNKSVPAEWAYRSIIWQYHREIATLRKMLKDNPDMTVITFLQPAIPLVLLAARDLPNKVIISERCDPNRLMKKRYGRLFIEKYYERANVSIFQTEDAKSVYPDNVSRHGIVIENPIRENLPVPYRGERNKTITTFCRISEQKNLPLLIQAFYLLNYEYPEYQLRIIGDAPNEDDKKALEKCKELIFSLNLEKKIKFEPFMANVHEAIIKDAMYVNSSDYEGMSNAMLEAMAIGMPVVCTDCPIGGAKAMIQDGENGLLVPVGDYEALYKAMKKVVEDQLLAERMAEKATELRKTLSLENIAKRWMELL